MSEHVLRSTNYSRIGFDIALGLVSIWALHDSKAPWLGYSIMSMVVIMTIITQRQVLVDEIGIRTTYFLRPFLRHSFVPIDAVKSVEWKGGHYTASSFVRIKYSKASHLYTMPVIITRSDWPLLLEILRRGNPTVEVRMPR
jgi:hypothetical protein